jgi:SAM-dependent methyltransferase
MEADAYLEMARVEDSHWWFVARRKIISSLIPDLELPDPASILEVGCGTGGNLEMLSRFGRVSGMEMDESARKIANQKTHGAFEIREGTCPDNVPFESERFDLICLFDVLEHIEEDVATLSRLKRLLAPGGKLLITVPAYKWLWGTHDGFLHHKRRYSAQELRQTFDGAGLGISKISYFNSILFPLALLARSASKSTSPGAALPSPAINEMLCRIFGAERFVLRRAGFPFGLSLIAVCHGGPSSRG